MTRRSLIRWPAAIVTAACAILLPCAAGAAPAWPVWLGAFGHSPTAYNRTPPVAATRPDGTSFLRRPGYAPLPPYDRATVREVTRITAAATAIRLRFTNEFGATPLRIGAAHVALAGQDGAIMPGSDHIVTFAGRGDAVIPPGAPLLSDPIDWSLPAFARLAISVYYPEPTVPPAHTLYALDAFRAGQPGDFTAAQTLPPAPAGTISGHPSCAASCPFPAPGGIHVSEIDIVPATARHTLVAFGDSITEGVLSTPGAFSDWPDVLAERLQADPATRDWSVVNAGIGSDRLLHDTPATSALSRFDRDVLSVPGVSAVIVLLGINDIQYSHRDPAEAVHAPDEIAAFGQLIARAHARGIRIYGATITPFAGSPDYTPEGEADRQAMNAFIRSGAFDGVIDFDAALRDPVDPARLRVTFDSGGHLHPDDAGYKAMADAVPLGLFRAGPPGL